MANTHELITKVYEAFNRRDIDAAFGLMNDEVSWPKASEGGHVIGKEEIRAYWTRQWAHFDPHVEPLEIYTIEGLIHVKVRQVVKNLQGEILSDSEAGRTYTITNGRIVRMDLEGSNDSAPTAAFVKHQLA